MNLLRLTPAMAGLLRLWTRTIRYRLEEADFVRAMVDKGEYGVLVTWHHDYFSLAGLSQRHNIRLAVAVSLSKDGEISNRILQRLGMATARGSSSRGGIRALIGLMRLMQREKRFAALTVDGPRGPLHEVKDGAFFLARQAGVPIIPVRAFPRRKLVMKKAWDKFQVPLPFTRCVVRCAEPYFLNEEKLTDEVLVRERAKLKALLDGLER